MYLIVLERFHCSMNSINFSFLFSLHLTIYTTYYIPVCLCMHSLCSPFFIHENPFNATSVNCSSSPGYVCALASTSYHLAGQMRWPRITVVVPKRIYYGRPKTTKQPPANHTCPLKKSKMLARNHRNCRLQSNKQGNVFWFYASLCAKKV